MYVHKPIKRALHFPQSTSKFKNINRFTKKGQQFSE